MSKLPCSKFTKLYIEKGKHFYILTLMRTKEYDLLKLINHSNVGVTFLSFVHRCFRVEISERNADFGKNCRFLYRFCRFWISKLQISDFETVDF